MPRGQAWSARGESLGNEVERLSVNAASVVQRAALKVVEASGVAGVEAAFVVDLVAEVGRHLVHEPEDAAACCPREENSVGVEWTENVERQALGAELFLDGSDDIRAERA